MVASFNRNPFGVWSVKLFLGSFITEIMTIGATLLAKSLINLIRRKSCGRRQIDIAH